MREVAIPDSLEVEHPIMTGEEEPLLPPAGGTSVRVLSSTKLLVTAPRHAAGLVDLRVTTSTGSSLVVLADR